MIRIYNEDALQNLLHPESAFRPSGVGFILIYEGSLKLAVNEEPLLFQKGTLVLLSGTNVYQALSGSADCRFYIVSFDPKELRQRLHFNFNGYNSYRLAGARSAKGRAVLPIPEREFGSLLVLCQQLEYHVHNEAENHFRDDIITALSAVAGLTIADELLKNIPHNEHSNPRKEHITALFLNLVTAHFKSEKELKFYADALCISVKYLSNCVREVTHLPPTHFLAEALVDEAKELLLNTQAPVYAIADELQFSDPYAFGKFFKKHTGKSPLHFRKQKQRVDTI